MSSLSTASQTQTELTTEANTLVTVYDQQEQSAVQQSPKPGCSSEGQAPSKPPRGNRSSPGSHRKGSKNQGPRLNRPPKIGNIHVRNRYDALSDMEEDYYAADLDNT